MAQKRKHIHFMGIGGSALAGVAILAQHEGYKVTGCDLSPHTYYTDFLVNEKINPILGHNKTHLEGVDILAVSPAIFDVSNENPEVVEARKRDILMTWQELMGRYLQKDKYVIAIAGTHGKSTTTALTGLVLEAGGVDPIVEVGAIVPEWKKTIRIGKSRYFVCEADEFNYNFLNYSPSILIINNIEMDHPEFYKNFEDFRNSFDKLIRRLTGSKILIVNEESLGIQELLGEMSDWLSDKKIKVIGYFLKRKFKFPFADEYRGEIIKLAPNYSWFRVKGGKSDEEFVLKIPGRHNIANALGVWAGAAELGIKADSVRETFKRFSGVERRFSLTGEEKGIKVFDDYAVHPTAVGATMQAAKQAYPKRNIWVVFEPHQFSRLEIFMNGFASALKPVYKVIVTKPYAGREKDQGKVKPEDLVKKIGKKAKYISEFQEVANDIASKCKKGEIIIVSGAGKSYELSQLILNQIRSKK
ncbi:MAG: UDP-N-acetylmuramate-L-alanine ligase [Candidatus Amesbacteria bacterium GW2011_GWB1_48_13]|uniref:UDP-N-acetylmuramate--L-alanine ligase n=3 Tax=Candidatus Amesiibacteriota TaxID=1752730 RepID=A0A0G1UTS9_9BACT|nr:MAG: UDP-N-acetylmuramate-L-alanine ligase [Candidatus Amesbacteria bacterium GW2011_GWB1_48_13]